MRLDEQVEILENSFDVPEQLREQVERCVGELGITVKWEESGNVTSYVDHSEPSPVASVRRLLLVDAVHRAALIEKFQERSIPFYVQTIGDPEAG